MRLNPKAARERDSRFIKSLLQVGDRRDETYKKSVGLKLEITPLENPHSKKVGDRLSFQVLSCCYPHKALDIWQTKRERAAGWLPLTY